MPSVEPALSAFVSAARAPARDTRASSQRVDTAANQEFSSLLDQAAPADDPAPARPERTRTGGESRSRRETVTSDRAQDRAGNSADRPAAPDDPPADPAKTTRQDDKGEAAVATAAMPDLPADGKPANEGDAPSPESEIQTDVMTMIDPSAVAVAPPPVAAVPTPAAVAAVDVPAADGESIKVGPSNPTPGSEAAADAAAAPPPAERAAGTPAPAADPKNTPTANGVPTEPEMPAAVAASLPPATTAAGKPAGQPAKSRSEPAAVEAVAGKPEAEATPQSEISTAPATRQDTAQTTRKIAADTFGDQPATPDTPANAPAHAAAHPPIETLHPLAATAMTAAPASAGLSASQQTVATVPLSGLAVEIATRAQGGSNRFEIRLDPPELGRIDIRLDVDRNGNVTSHLVVERSETLDLLRRDAPNLERALQDAGLKTGDSALQFSLRDQNPGGDRDARETRLPNPAETEAPQSEIEPIIQAARSYRWAGTTSGIDIRV